jgi:DNA (cytosine-5)-methyltransferase 1
VEKRIRDLAWVVVHWAKRVQPRVIMLENVEEFRDWGPLVEAEDGRMKPCPAQKGVTFRRWVRELKREGYRVEWRELRACDYGAPTIRKRLFVIARRDDQPIAWPVATHGDPKTDAVKTGALKPWRSAAECIDWSLPCPSIFLTRAEGKALGYDIRRPLAEATMARIAKGVFRYVLHSADPFIVPITHTYDSRVHAVDDPLRTVTTAKRGEHALVTPFVTKFRKNSVGHDTRDPLHTITSHHSETHPGGAAPLGIVVPTLVGCGGRAGQSAPRGGAEPTGTMTAKPDGCVVAAHLMTMRNSQKPHNEADKPAHTLTAGGANQAVVAAFLAQHNTDMVGHAATEPVSTIVGKGCTQAVVSAGILNMKGSDRRDSDVEAPAPTICAGGLHVAEVRAFLMKYYGTAVGQDAREPLHTVTARDRMGVVTIKGEEWQIVDIGMRMLTARERFNAQGFPRDYIIDLVVPNDGAPYPLRGEAQGRLVGNSVCPPLAEALVRANFAAAEQVAGAAD